MRKNGTWFLATLASLGIVGLAMSRAHAADWIQQNKWTVAGPYVTGGCDPGAQAGEKTIDEQLLVDMDIDAINPVHGEPAPNLANIKVGNWPEFDTWQLLSTRGIPAGDLCNLNDVVFGSDPNDVYAVGVIYAKNKTAGPLDITFCSGTDDSIGIVVNDTLVLSKITCRGDPGCGERTAATLQPGVNKIAIAAFEGGGGWNWRLQLRRTADDTIIDDTEAPDVAFDSNPGGNFDQFLIRRSVAGGNTCGSASVDVNLKSNGLFLGSPGDPLVVTERVTGPVKVSNISGGGAFVADAPQTSSCDLPGTPVGPFTTLDIGGPAVAGSTTPIDANTVAVKGGGNDIWAGGDQFQFAYVTALGDFRASAHIVKRDYLPGPNPPSRWGKFGVMARQDCTPNSRYVMAQDNSLDSNGTDPDSTRMAARPTHGGADNYETGFGNADQHVDWLRVDRVGNQFYCYGSPDGTEWVLLGQQHWNDAPDRCLVGLAVTSHAGAAPIEITFDQLTIQGGTTPTPADVARSGTITWNTTPANLDAGLSYTVAAATANTDVANFNGGIGGQDDKGHTINGAGSPFFGHERGAVGPDFTHSFDVGNDIAGTSSYDAGSGVYTMRGSGFDVWGDNESFHWAYSYQTGDFDIIVETLEASQPLGSAHGRYGLMARAHCGGNAQSTAMGGHVGIGTDGRTHCQQDGGTCGFRFLSQVFWGDRYVGFDNQTDVRYPGGEPAKWTRMIKHNNVIYGYAADDEGETWRPVGSMPFYGADPEKPIQVGFYVQQHGGQLSSPVVKFKVHKFGPLDTELPPIPDDGVGERSELLADSFDSFDTTAWQAQHRDAAFNPVVIDGRLRLTDEAADGESTSCFSTFGVEDIDAAIYEFEFDAYMTYLNTNGAGHPADGMCFVVSGELDPATLGRVGFGGGNMAYHGLNRAFGALGGDTNIGNNSFAVELDTWAGGGWAPNEGIGLPALDGTGKRFAWHIGVNSGNNINSLVTAHNLGDDGAGGVIPLPDLFDPNGIHMKVRYNRGKVSVWVGQNTAEGQAEELTKAVETEVVPISLGYPNATATYGWTAANGGAREIAEVDNFAAYVTDCNDIQDIAAISGAPAGNVDSGQTITLGSDGSSAGVGDSGALSYLWSVVSGPGSIDGSSTGPTVNVKAGPGSGDLKVRLVVSDNDGCAGNSAGTADVTIRVLGGIVNTWVRGDANGDKTVDISDPVFSLTFQFVGGPASACPASLDSNADGSVDISDPVIDLGRLFLGDPLPAAWQQCEPFAGCGPNCP